MQQRPAGAVDESRRLLELELPYVAFAEVELDSLRDRTLACLREHSRRGIDPDDALARSPSNRDRNASGANRKFDERPVRLAGKPDVERDVVSDASRPLVVSVSPGVVPARHCDANLSLCSEGARHECLAPWLRALACASRLLALSRTSDPAESGFRARGSSGGLSAGELGKLLDVRGS